MRDETGFRRRVCYYETDRMDIVHHSNYIRYMEEGRVDFLKKIGMDLTGLEKIGILMPVTGVECRYIASLHFDEEFLVRTTLEAFNGVRAEFSYEIIRPADGERCAEGRSGHCFVRADTRLPIHLKKYAPGEYARGLVALVRPDGGKSE